MKANYRPVDKGVTLIEIFIVVAIIAALTAVVVPTMSRVKANAYSVQCMGKLRDIGIGLNQYFADRGMTFPTMVAARESREDDVPAIDTVLLDYVGDEFAFECPADHEGIFEKTGSSYFWNSLINGQRMGNMDLLGMIRKESGIPIASDKENFHQHVGDGVNVLYADGHVTRRLQFIVEQE
jgi:prepilin-type processing-associated H-X9-DG protein/prepilin-type N-terminal cleavage/methylation domain-containing protein